MHISSCIDIESSRIMKWTLYCSIIWTVLSLCKRWSLLFMTYICETTSIWIYLLTIHGPKYWNHYVRYHKLKLAHLWYVKRTLCSVMYIQNILFKLSCYLCNRKAVSCANRIMSAHMVPVLLSMFYKRLDNFTGRHDNKDRTFTVLPIAGWYLPFVRSYASENIDHY